jgi:hypothetical protein
MSFPVSSSTPRPTPTPALSVKQTDSYARPAGTRDSRAPDAFDPFQARTTPHDVDLSLRDHGEAGPHFNADLNDRGGLETDFGLLRIENEDGSRLTGLDAEAEFGVWTDATGETRTGTRADGQVFGVSGPEDMLVRPELDVLGFNKETSYSDSELRFGVQGYLAQGAFTLTESDASRHTDVTQRFGLGAGVGAAGRLHYGDADGDGYREYGFGFDGGPFSYDLKLEAGGIAESVSETWSAVSEWWSGEPSPSAE